MKRFIKTVLLLLASPFVFFMLGLVLALVRLGDFFTDDDCRLPITEDALDPAEGRLLGRRDKAPGRALPSALQTHHVWRGG